MLFKPSLINSQQLGLPLLTMTSLNKCDVALKKNLMGNILLCGGCTTLKGFADRFQRELIRMCPNDNPISSASPERKTSVWTGGSILASLKAFQQLWVHRREYEEKGNFLLTFHSQSVEKEVRGCRGGSVRDEGVCEAQVSEEGSRRVQGVVQQHKSGRVHEKCSVGQGGCAKKDWEHEGAWVRENVWVWKEGGQQGVNNEGLRESAEVGEDLLTGVNFPTSLPIDFLVVHVNYLPLWAPNFQQGALHQVKGILKGLLQFLGLFIIAIQDQVS
ncbi:Actin-like protein 7A, partial [Ophiophagus hannah]